MQGIIYQAIHIVSGRIYVGQTYSHKIRTPEQLLADRRLRHHRLASSSTSKKTHFAQALSKYGLDQFEWSVIDFADAIEVLNRLESHYIETLCASSDLNGFNTRLEGDNRILTSHAKADMAKAALVRWENISADGRKQLTSKQQQGRDRRPELREASRVRMKAMLTDEKFVEKMTVNRRSATKTPEFRAQHAELTKKFWKTTTKEKKEKILRPMRDSPIRLVNQLKKMKTDEYRKNLTDANRRRRQRPFVIMAIRTGEIVGDFVNIADAARLLDSHAPNISITLNGKGKAFTVKNPKYKAFGKLTARWRDDMKPIEMPFDAKRKSVDIFTATDKKMIATFKGIRVANVALDAQIGAVLSGRTKTFRAKASKYKEFGPLVAVWSDAVENNIFE